MCKTNEGANFFYSAEMWVFFLFLVKNYSLGAVFVASMKASI